MYSTEFSSEVSLGKIEQEIDGCCFLPKGSNSKPQNHARGANSCQRLYSFLSLKLKKILVCKHKLELQYNLYSHAATNSEEESCRKHICPN